MVRIFMILLATTTMSISLACEEIHQAKVAFEEAERAYKLRVYGTEKLDEILKKIYPPAKASPEQLLSLISFDQQSRATELKKE